MIRDIPDLCSVLLWDNAVSQKMNLFKSHYRISEIEESLVIWHNPKFIVEESKVNGN